MTENVTLIELEKRIELVTPITHKNLSVSFCLILGKVKVHGNDSVELIQLFFIEVIFCDCHITWPHFCTFPGSKPHIWFIRVNTLIDQFRRSLAGYGKMQFVLND